MYLLGVSVFDYVQIILLLLMTFVLAKPLGIYLAKIYGGNRSFLSPIIEPVESLIYRICGIDSKNEMNWKVYASSLVFFSFVLTLTLFFILIFNDSFPDAKGKIISPDLAFNIAASFVTNTNLQAYSGEILLSNYVQMLGLTVQNFVSASMGMAVLMALVRGIHRKNSMMIGNFWVDIVRGVLYILLPLAIIWAIILGGQGVVQTLDHNTEANLLQKQITKDKKDILQEQLNQKQGIAVGPVASQLAIKQLGSNGGGFFNANSAHPFENPTAFSNFMQMMAILLLPIALCYAFGKMVGDDKQSRSILIAMTIIFLPLLFFCIINEQNGNIKFPDALFDDTPSYLQSGGNMDGKEVRFGIVNSAFWATATTATSNGSVNSSHASFTPLGGMIPLVMMHFGEVIYGGVGSGLYGMLVFVIITVFIVGLMVGRTPEYMGKKIQAFEIKMASLIILIPCILTLVGTAFAVMSHDAASSTLNKGSAGFTELIYAFTSAANNNGSLFAGLNINTQFFNIVLGITMLISRFWIMLLILAIAGSLASKNIVPSSSGTLKTTSSIFIAVLATIIVIIGVLTYIPSLALGPIVEHLQLING